MLQYPTVTAMMLDVLPMAQLSIVHTPAAAELCFDGDKRWFVYTTAAIFALKPPTFAGTADEEAVEAQVAARHPFAQIPSALLALVLTSPDGGYLKKAEFASCLMGAIVNLVLPLAVPGQPQQLREVQLVVDLPTKGSTAVAAAAVAAAAAELKFRYSAVATSGGHVQRGLLQRSVLAAEGESSLDALARHRARNYAALRRAYDSGAALSGCRLSPALAIVHIAKHSDAYAYRTLALHLPQLRVMAEPLSAHAADIARVVSERPERVLPLWRPCVTEELVLARCAAIYSEGGDGGDGDGGDGGGGGGGGGLVHGSAAIRQYTPPPPPPTSYATLKQVPVVGDRVEARFGRSSFQGLSLTPGGSQATPGLALTPWLLATVERVNGGHSGGSSRARDPCTVDLQYDDDDVEFAVPLVFVAPAREAILREAAADDEREAEAEEDEPMGDSGPAPRTPPRSDERAASRRRMR